MSELMAGDHVFATVDGTLVEGTAMYRVEYVEERTFTGPLNITEYKVWEILVHHVLDGEMDFSGYTSNVYPGGVYYPDNGKMIAFRDVQL
jgi:hypothetical protein